MNTRILIPATRPEDWRRLLAEPEKHWRDGFTAQFLANTYSHAKPPTTQRKQGNIYENFSFGGLFDIQSEPDTIFPTGRVKGIDMYLVWV